MAFLQINNILKCGAHSNCETSIITKEQYALSKTKTYKLSSRSFQIHFDYSEPTGLIHAQVPYSAWHSPILHLLYHALHLSKSTRMKTYVLQSEIESNLTIRVIAADFLATALSSLFDKGP